MLERGLLPDFSEGVFAELGEIRLPSGTSGEPTRDLRDLLWASIDNDDSRDLDQLTVAEALSGDGVKILVAVADVAALVKTGSAIDDHAQHNTTSVYTAAQVFPMLPEDLPTNLTSLNLGERTLLHRHRDDHSGGRVACELECVSRSSPQSRQACL